ncbi:MAG TPA: PQQ-binding-like beta-propeller repeat protein, partial [Bryobacteraceae bacterium]|nr:PQQ-binding-like beta-propeller repeat protein [Bryobacteraceae bacterium]
MRRTHSLVLTAVLASSVALPQAAVDWPSYGGDARRTGWERSDTRITKDNVKDFRLVLKRKLEGTATGPYTSTAPVIIGRLISYRGFKELGFVSNNAGDLWSIDVDLNRVFWKKRYPAASNGACAEIASAPALTPPAVFGRRRPTSGAKPGGTNSPSPGLPPTTAGRTTERPTASRVVAAGFGGPRPVYVVTSDGKLHQVNTSDGSDQFPPLAFLPGGAKPSPLTLHDNVIYTTVSGKCGSTKAAVYAMDLADEEPRVSSFPLEGGDPMGPGGFALGNDGTVYVQTEAKLAALTPRDLKLKGAFPAPAAAPKSAPELNATTPLVFDLEGRDMVVSAGRDGRLYLLDSQAIGDEQKAVLSRTAPVASAGGGIWGGLSSWEDADGVRWVAAPVWGAVNPELKLSGSNGAASNGSIVAFRVEEQGGKPVLTPAWVSRDLNSPVPPVITTGVVFALSTGGSNAVLYALDAATGKEMYSTGSQVTGRGSLTGLTLANSRVFFTTVDGTLYGFGI